MCFFLCITTICCNNGNAIKYEDGKNNSTIGTHTVQIDNHKYIWIYTIFDNDGTWIHDPDCQIADNVKMLLQLDSIRQNSK
jgi:hypothetical protein